MNVPDSVREFWRTFEQRSDALRNINSADDPTYDAVLEALQRIEPGLYFEFSSEPGELEFIVTADGNRELFPLVDAIVAAAPQQSEWTIRALKPQLGWPRTVAWERYEIDIMDVVFEPLQGERPDEIGLRLLVPNLTDDDEMAAHNAMLRAIDHGLGEREFAEAIAFTEIAPLGERRPDYRPITQLEEFIRNQGL